jgi:hypothetical protein
VVSREAVCWARMWRGCWSICRAEVSTLLCYIVFQHLLGERTFFNLALKKLLTRNLNLSSSVCTMISLKLVFGSMLPVCSSTSSICLRH